MNNTIDVNTVITGDAKNDLVEVVRCKDCKHIDLETAEPIISNGIASAICWCDLFQQNVRIDGFCSYGERRAE